MTVEETPFQTMFQCDIMSRPISIPKFCGLVGLPAIKPRSHDPTRRLRNGDNFVLTKLTSIAKFGIVCGPAAVRHVDFPTGTKLKRVARFISMHVLLAPVSKCAVTTIEESGQFNGGRLYSDAVVNSTNKLNPNCRNGNAA
jgi:hypothetical protein